MKRLAVGGNDCRGRATGNDTSVAGLRWSAGWRASSSVASSVVRRWSLVVGQPRPTPVDFEREMAYGHARPRPIPPVLLGFCGQPTTSGRFSGLCLGLQLHLAVVQFDRVLHHFAAVLFADLIGLFADEGGEGFQVS